MSRSRFGRGGKKRKSVCPYLLCGSAAHDLADRLPSCFLKFFLSMASWTFKELCSFSFSQESSAALTELSLVFISPPVCHWPLKFRLSSLSFPRATFSVWMALSTLAFTGQTWFLPWVRRSFLSSASQSPPTGPIEQVTLSHWSPASPSLFLFTRPFSSRCFFSFSLASSAPQYQHQSYTLHLSLVVWWRNVSPKTVCGR